MSDALKRWNCFETIEEYEDYLSKVRMHKCKLNKVNARLYRTCRRCKGKFKGYKYEHYCANCKKPNNSNLGKTGIHHYKYINKDYKFKILTP